MKRNIIKYGRESLGLNQKEMAQILGNSYSPDKISKMESGARSIDDDYVERLAENTRHNIDFYRNASLVDLSENNLFRKKASTKVKTKLQVKTEFQLYAYMIDKMLDKIDLEFAHFDFKNIDPVNLALEIRYSWNLSNQPIENLVKELEIRGIFVLFLDDLPGEIDGFNLYSLKHQPIIFINNKKSNDRKLFSIAYEFGHLLLYYKGVTSKDKKIIESMVDDFASELLLPSTNEELKSKLGYFKLNDLIDLKIKWKSSIQALLYKAGKWHTKQNQKKWQKYLWVEISRRGWIKNEPYPVEIQKPKLFKICLDIYLNQLGYSRQSLADYFNISLEKFNELVFSEEAKPKDKIKLNNGGKVWY